MALSEKSHQIPRIRVGFAPQTRETATLFGGARMQQFDFERISASLTACRLFATITSFYVSKKPDNLTTRNSICPSNSALPSLSLQSLFQLAHNKKNQLRSKFNQSQLLKNWANSLSGRATRAPFSLPALISAKILGGV